MEMAKGTDVRLAIDDDDLDFVWNVRKAYIEQGYPATMLPPPPRVLQVRYALLHPKPLHKLTMGWAIDNNAKVLKIFKDQQPVATVGNEMRANFARANGKQGNDEEVARWWILENQNAIHQNVDSDGNPKAQIKIVRRGTNSVDIAFRSSKKYWGWNVVEKIPIDMKKFRAKVGSEGFAVGRHAVELLKISSSTWESLIASDNKSDHTVRPKAGKFDHFAAGYFAQDNSVSDSFIGRYENDMAFRELVNATVAKVVTSSINRNIIKVGGTIAIDDDFNITIRPNFILQEKTVRAVIEGAFQRLRYTSGVSKINWSRLTQRSMADPDSRLNNWLRREAANGALNTWSSAKAQENV